MNVDRALVDLRCLPPHPVEQLRAREHPPRLLQQIFEQPKLGRPKMDVAHAAPHPPRLPVEIEIAGIETLGDPLRTAAAQKRAHPRHQFGHREGLHHIIVGADRKPAHTLSLFPSRGDHDHRQRAGQFAGA